MATFRTNTDPSTLTDPAKRPVPQRTPMDLPSRGGKPRIVVVGGGFGGAYCVQKLERLLDPDEADITLIDRRNYFAFTPLLVETATGAVNPRHSVIELRTFLRRSRLITATVDDIDLDKQQLEVRALLTGRPTTVGFDHLVLAMGSVTRLPPVDGLVEHGYEMKSLADAIRLRNRVIALLEAAALEHDESLRRKMLRIVVVGGNYTGVEIAAELHAMITAACHRFGIDRSEIDVTLVEIDRRLLNALDESLADYAADTMRRRGLQIRLNETVQRITAEEAQLKSGETIPTQTVIWCAGVAPPPLLDSMDLTRDDKGYIRCDRDTRVEGFQTVWAVGDCAANPDETGSPYPPTAQHARREGLDAARNIVHAIRGRPTRPSNIRSKGTLAPLGCRTGVARVFGVKFSGFPAWWLYRTVYLLLMPGLRRKLRVAFDWTLELVGRRELIRIDVAR